MPELSVPESGAAAAQPRRRVHFVASSTDHDDASGSMAEQVEYYHFRPDEPVRTRSSKGELESRVVQGEGVPKRFLNKKEYEQYCPYPPFGRWQDRLQRLAIIMHPTRGVVFLQESIQQHIFYCINGKLYDPQPEEPSEDAATSEFVFIHPSICLSVQDHRAQKFEYDHFVALLLRLNHEINPRFHLAESVVQKYLEELIAGIGSEGGESKDWIKYKLVQKLYAHMLECMDNLCGGGAYADYIVNLVTFNNDGAQMGEHIEMLLNWCAETQPDGDNLYEQIHERYAGFLLAEGLVDCKEQVISYSLGFQVKETIHRLPQLIASLCILFMIFAGSCRCINLKLICATK